MIDDLLSYIAPHLCCGCGKAGSLLCDNCKYDIISEKYSVCIACGTLAGSVGLCRNCNVPYSRGWCVGERSGVLQRLIGDFKFQSVYAAHRVLADVLLAQLDQLPGNTIVVPVPTVTAHIRRRGYDHTLLIARRIAKKRNLRLSQALYRRTATKQRDASRSIRLAQAKVAFGIKGKADAVPYLLIDDVVTTGATIRYAAQALKDAGAREVWVAAIARQTLD